MALSIVQVSSSKERMHASVSLLRGCRAGSPCCWRVDGWTSGLLMSRGGPHCPIEASPPLLVPCPWQDSKSLVDPQTGVPPSRKLCLEQTQTGRGTTYALQMTFSPCDKVSSQRKDGGWSVIASVTLWPCLWSCNCLMRRGRVADIAFSFSYTAAMLLIFPHKVGHRVCQTRFGYTKTNPFHEEAWHWRQLRTSWHGHFH